MRAPDMIKLPNFFIVGAAKAGTTSMYNYLKQHPDIFMPDVKEPHFFVDWRGMVSGMAEYKALFSNWSGQKAVGEASTGYLFDERSPARIKEFVPDAKIIIMLRDPADTAFSLWRHMRKLGKRGEKLPFEEALNEEKKRIEDPGFASRNTKSWHGNFYYFNRGLYYSQVKRYLDTFGKENVLIIIFKNFCEDPVTACKKVYKFLGVDESFTPAIARFNQIGWVRHRGIESFQSKSKSYMSWLAVILKRLNDKPVPRLDESMRAYLIELYRPDIERLEKLIGEDLSLWYRV